VYETAVSHMPASRSRQ